MLCPLPLSSLSLCAGRYKKDGEAVLRGISFATGLCEKVGVVGRTGAGKSSIMNALFRMVELSQGQALLLLPPCSPSAES